MDTGAKVTVPGTEVYNLLQEKPPRQQASDYVASWGWRPPEGFHSWPFDVKAAQNVHQVDLYVALLKDSMLLGMDFLWDHRAELDLIAGTLCLGSETICMTWGRSPGSLE